MKKIYQEAEIELVSIKPIDIICASEPKEWVVDEEEYDIELEGMQQ